MEEEGRRGKETQFGIKQELKQAIKIDLSQISSQHSPPIEVPNIQVLAASVSTKGSCDKADTNPLGFVRSW